MRFLRTCKLLNFKEGQNCNKDGELGRLAFEYNVQMTMRHNKDKNQEGRLRLLQQPFGSPRIKVHQPETTPITSIQDLKSPSRGHHRTKRHMFKSPNLLNDDPFNSPHFKQPIKSYSSLGTLPHYHQKPKFNARQFLAQRNALPPGAKKVNKEKVEVERKEKRQFKLIHQIKMEKASKMHEKQKILLRKPVQRQNKTAIESASNDKMDDFVEQMQLILEPSQKHLSSVELSSPPPYQEPHQPKLSSIKEQISPVMTQKSTVSIQLPSELLRSKEHSLVKKQSMEEQHKTLDLNRSISKAERLLKNRKDSISSMDISLRESKVRAQISISLALESVHNTRVDLSAFYKGLQGKYGKNQGVSCKQKINAHLEILKSMGIFVYESTKFDQIGDEWEELNFLIYKKFYIERRKVLNFIQKYPMRNPFCIYSAQIGSKQIIQFMKTQEGGSLLNQLKKQTNEIKQKLAKIYARFDKEKVGEKINLYEYDNFSHWIVEQLWAELILTEHNISHSRQIINLRLCRILQLIFLISELNGKFECGFEEAQQAIEEGQIEEYIKEGKQIFQKYILYKDQGSENIIL